MNPLDEDLIKMFRYGDDPKGRTEFHGRIDDEALAHVGGLLDEVADAVEAQRTYEEEQREWMANRSTTGSSGTA